MEITNDNQHVIKEYHFYISDDHMHDTHYVQHCFDIIYGSLKTGGVIMNENWIWSNGCARKFKSSRSFFWLCRLHKKQILNIIGFFLKLVMEKESTMVQERL